MRHMKTTAIVMCTFAGTAIADPLNIFWIGNSHTRWLNSTSTTPNLGQTPGVAELVADLAEAAGYERPNNYWEVIDGSFISQRIPRVDSLVSSAIPGGVAIDTLVMQGNSTESLPWLNGNADNFATNTATIEEAFRTGNNGNMETVLYQTWARSRAHPNYQDNGGPVPDIQSWHNVNRTSYENAAAGINANGGNADLGRVGDAWALADWAPELYRDNNHFSREGGVLASVVLFNAIYKDDISRVNINLNEFDDPIELRLRQLGVDAAEWANITDIATQVIPAPSSAAALLVLGGVMGNRRRR